MNWAQNNRDCDHKVTRRRAGRPYRVSRPERGTRHRDGQMLFMAKGSINVGHARGYEPAKTTQHAKKKKSAVRQGMATVSKFESTMGGRHRADGIKFAGQGGDFTIVLICTIRSLIKKNPISGLNGWKHERSPGE